MRQTDQMFRQRGTVRKRGRRTVFVGNGRKGWSGESCWSREVGLKCGGDELMEGVSRTRWSRDTYGSKPYVLGLSSGGGGGGRVGCNRDLWG